VPVQAQLAGHGPVEGADQEVGEQVRAGLLVEERREPGLAREQVVAVQSGQPAQPQLGADLVEGAVGAAVRVGHGDVVVRRGQLERERADLARDLLRLVVQQRGQRVDGDRPAAARDDVGDRLGDGAAGDDRGPSRRRAARRSGR
jgi:hypothetical protein